jgi:hypothetical protein
MNIITFKSGLVGVFLAMTLGSLGVSADSVASNKLVDIPVRLISQSYEGNELTVIVADLGRTGIQHSSLTLTTSSNNFNREVQIEGGDDNQTWIKLESVVEKNTINYSAVTFRYLRITIYDHGAKRLIIAGALAHLPTASTGTSTPSSIPSPAPSIPFYEQPLYLIIGVGALAVGVIGGLAFRLFKQTQV